MTDSMLLDDFVYPTLSILENDRDGQDGDGAAHQLSLSYPGGRSPTRAWPLHVDASDIASFSDRLIRELGIVSRYGESAFAAAFRSEEERRDPMREIMRLTHSFLLEAMGDDQLASLHDALMELPSGSALEVIAGTQATATFPWAMLHPGPVPLTAELTPGGLLGHRFILVGELCQPTPVAINARALDVFLSGNRRYGFVDDDELPAVRAGIEREVLRTLTGDDFDPLHIVPKPEAETLDDSNPTLQSLADLATYLNVRRRVVHFACHGAFGTRGAKRSRYTFRVRHKHEVEANTLDKEMSRAQESPVGAVRAGIDLLFLNMCHSATTRGINRRDATSALHSLRPRAAIGTLGPVCDTLAAHHAASFYQQAFGRKLPVGEAFLEARREALAKFNPAYLLFVLEGSPDVELG